jgi:hypothetical protein
LDSFLIVGRKQRGNPKEEETNNDESDDTTSQSKRPRYSDFAFGDSR